MDKIPVTVLVQTKNEENGIAVCLAGLTHFDEVIVVDSMSDDATADIARASGVKLVEFDWDGKYPKKKQWQLENVETKHAWVMFIDADETPNPTLLASLRSLFVDAPANVAAYDIRLDYVFAGRKLKHGHRVVKRCLVHRDRVTFPVVDDLEAPGMGELEGHYQPTAHGKVGKIRGRILHNDVDPVASWFARHNRYSDWEAYLRNRRDVGKSVAASRTIRGRIFDAIPAKSLLFFMYSYVFRLGFLDGRAGFDYAFALATYYWQIGLKVRELRGWGQHE